MTPEDIRIAVRDAVAEALADAVTALGATIAVSEADMAARVDAVVRRLDRVDPEGRLPGDPLADAHARLVDAVHKAPADLVAAHRGQADHLPDPARTPSAVQTWHESPGGLAADLLAGDARMDGLKFAAMLQARMSAMAAGVAPVVTDAPGLSPAEKSAELAKVHRNPYRGQV